MIEILEHREGLTLKLGVDPYPENPRQMSDSPSQMICFHDHYELGDDHDLTPDELIEIINTPGTLALPIILLDHSGLYLSTSRQYPFDCQWDAGQIGYIYVESGQIHKEWFGDQDVARNCLESEIEEYSQYLSGEVYYWEIEDRRDAHVDSCHGYYGYEYAESEALDAFEREIAHRQTFAIDPTF